MKKIKLVVQLTYDDQIMHEDDEEGIKWFHEEVLKNTNKNELLYLHSNFIGYEVGEIKILEIL